MYIKSRFIPVEKFIHTFESLKEINFSFFADYIPTHEELNINPINVFAHAEINEYFGHHDWIIENQNYFSIILTWSDRVLNNCENAIYLPFGTTWLKPHQYEKNYPKYFQASHVRGDLFKTYGHSLRFEYHNRSQNELKIPFKSWEVAGDKKNIETCAEAKCELFGDSQFGVVIENASYRGYFTEKIIEMFLFKTIPVYWGCSDIEDFFNIDGIITFNNVDDAIFKLNNLDENYYNDRLEAIEENHNIAKQYLFYDQNAFHKITEIFKLNNLI
jgi:hypothetical protein